MSHYAKNAVQVKLISVISYPSLLFLPKRITNGKDRSKLKLKGNIHVPKMGWIIRMKGMRWGIWDVRFITDCKYYQF